MHFEAGNANELPCVGITGKGEMGSEVPLNVMDRVENDHAGSDRDAIIEGLPAVRIAPKNAQSSFLHDGSFSCERFIASFHPRGKAEPNTFHLVNLVGPMCGIIAFIACP